MPHEHKTLYDQLGEETFTRLIAAFYHRVEVDPILRPLYPGSDLAEAERYLRLFVIQYFGGPTAYGDERGHPRLRMRHMPFKIGAAERDAWLNAMFGAMDEMAIPEPANTTLRDYFKNAADFMINDGGLSLR